MPHAFPTRPPRSPVGVRRASARFALALCAALLAAMGLGGAASGGPAGSGGYGAAPTPATVRAVGSGTLGGAANRVRPTGQHENSKPAYATAHRAHPDTLPAATAVDRLDLAEPILPAGRALTGAPVRAPPVPAGLPDTRAPPASGRL